MNRLIVLVSLIFVACASTTHFQSYPNLDSNSNPTARIHVVRLNRFVGSAITAPVYVDGYLIGRIGPGGYLTTPVPVGRVHVTSTTADVIVQTEQGSEYFFEVSGSLKPWIYAPHFDVFQIDKQRVKEILGHEPETKQQ